MSSEYFEALERTLLEIDALSAIYSSEDTPEDVALEQNKEQAPPPPPAAAAADNTAASTIQFSVLSIDEYVNAKSLLSDSTTWPFNLQDEQQVKIPTLVIQLLWRSQEANGHSISQNHHHQHQQQGTVHIELPQGYPAKISCPPRVSIISMTNWSRKQREELGNAMNEKARELSGSEALLELIHFFQDSMMTCCSSKVVLDHGYTSSEAKSNTKTSLSGSNKGKKNKRCHIFNCATTNEPDSKGRNDVVKRSLQGEITRCWIWVHHIKNVGRCKDIVREAKERRLAGYLKHGYPGIVVIEGPTALCNDFVQWIKGSKSRPGGFGRNWGHHVRGQIGLNQGSKRSFANEFQDIGEDLASLAAVCRQNAVEDEFLKYVMQH